MRQSGIYVCSYHPCCKPTCQLPAPSSKRCERQARISVCSFPHGCQPRCISRKLELAAHTFKGCLAASLVIPSVLFFRFFNRQGRVELSNHSRKSLKFGGNVKSQYLNTDYFLSATWKFLKHYKIQFKVNNQLNTDINNIKCNMHHINEELSRIRHVKKMSPPHH